MTGYIFSPLIPPWHAIVNTIIGLLVFYWITASGLHFSGAFFADYLPISDSNSYDNTQQLYNVSRVLTPEGTFDLAAYEAYSPLYLSTTFMLAYGLSFASITAVIVHTGLFHGREIINRLKASDPSLDDVHARMMRKYKPVPQWWFLMILVPCIALCFVTIYVWPVKLPWWAMIVALLISAAFFIPIGIVQALTNIQVC